jgi:hypothetical protein
MVGLPALARLARGAGAGGVGLLCGAIAGGAVLGNIFTGSLTRLPRLGLAAGAARPGGRGREVDSPPERPYRGGGRRRGPLPQRARIRGRRQEGSER